MQYSLVAVGWFVPDQVTLPWVGTVAWVDDLLGWGAAFLMIPLSVFLMAPVASAFTGLFLDEVADAVEDRHYSGLPGAARVSIADSIRDTLGFLGIMIGANAAALILYAVFPVFSPVIFWALNGFLLGREYFQLVAMRRLGRAGARALRKRHRSAIWIAGILMAMPLSVPVLNLLVPVMGVATFTHLFHRLRMVRP